MKPPYWLAIAISACAGMLLPVVALARGGVAVPLSDQRVAVISEGDLEPASIGSYSIAVFKDGGLVDLVAGAVFSRDGSLFPANGQPSVEFADIDGDGTKELILSKHTAGSGNHLEVDALRIDSQAVKLLARVRSDTRHDVLAALREAYKRGLRAGSRTSKDPR